jgi:hypothetical protein
LPNATISGTTPSCSKACMVPGRPRPILTSSQIIGTPWARHRSCRRRKETVGWHHQPAVGQDRLDDQAGDGPGRQMLVDEIQTLGDIGIDTRA